MADVADLALGDEVVERRERLLDRRDRVGLVQLVEVDPVGPQAAQRRLDGEPDVAARPAHAPVRTVRAGHVHAELGGEHDLVALALERLAHQRLGEPALRAVDVGGVEEGHAGVDRGADHRVRPSCVSDRRACAAEVVAAEADGRDDESGVSEGAVFDVLPCLRV